MIPLHLHREAQLIAARRSAEGAAEARRRWASVNQRAQPPRGHTPPQASWLATLLARMPRAHARA